VGKTEHHVKNSKHLAQTLADIILFLNGLYSHMLFLMWTCC